MAFEYAPPLRPFRGTRRELLLVSAALVSLPLALRALLSWWFRVDPLEHQQYRRCRRDRRRDDDHHEENHFHSCSTPEDPGHDGPDKWRGAAVPGGHGRQGRGEAKTHNQVDVDVYDSSHGGGDGSAADDDVLISGEPRVQDWQHDMDWEGDPEIPSRMRLGDNPDRSPRGSHLSDAPGVVTGPGSGNGSCLSPRNEALSPGEGRAAEEPRRQRSSSSSAMLLPSSTAEEPERLHSRSGMYCYDYNFSVAIISSAWCA